MNMLSLFPAIPLLMMLGLWLSKSTRQIRAVMVAGSSLLLLLAAGIALSGPVQALAPRLRGWLRGRAAPGAAGAAVLLLLLLAGIMRSTAGNYTAFIYFQF